MTVAGDTAPRGTVFVTWVENEEQQANARLWVASLHAFGGAWRDCAVWAFQPETLGANWASALSGVHCLPLRLGLDYPFANKVRACALAEDMVGRETRSLVWMDPCCLVLQLPSLLSLTPAITAAMRPVHIRNIGALAGQPLDSCWRGIYQAVGLEDTPGTVESFVDRQVLRPYFNTHLFAVDPAAGLLRRWAALFESLAADDRFQASSCADELHRIFLHQAVFSALVTKEVPRDSLRLLPPEYSYPLHLHHRLSPERQARLLNELVCPVYEDVYRHPQSLNGLRADEPLDTWLRDRISPG